MLKEIGATVKYMKVDANRQRNRGASMLDSNKTGFAKSYNTRRSNQPLSQTSSFSHHNFHKEPDVTLA